MSSDFQIICLSHDPAITVEQDYATSEQALTDAAEHYAHPDCDLIIGRWLRLALLAGETTTVRARVPGCWTYERLHKLRYVLGVEEAPPS